MYGCLWILRTHNHTHLHCQMFIFGYVIMLIPLPGKAQKISLHDSHMAVTLLLLLESSWVTRASFSLFWPSSSFHVPSIRLPLHFSLFCFLSLPLFFHSLSGRATCGGPSQPNPEPAGTRGSSGCNSEWIETDNPSHFVQRGGKQCSRILCNSVESMGPVYLGKCVLVTYWDDNRKDVHLLWIDSGIIFTGLVGFYWNV